MGQRRVNLLCTLHAVSVDRQMQTVCTLMVTPIVLAVSIMDNPKRRQE